MARESSYQQYGAPAGGHGSSPPPPPKKKRENPYYDGVSTSVQSYDLFEMIRNPYARGETRPPEAPSSPIPGKKPLSKQKKIEREVQKKFDENTHSSSQKGSFQFIGKLVRIIFLTVVLPPYLMIYKIPKWILFESVPWVERKIADACKRVCKKNVNAVKKAYIRIKTSILEAWQHLKAKDSDPKNNSKFDEEYLDFLTFILKGILWLRTLIVQPIKGGWRLMVSVWKKSVQFLNGIPNKMQALADVINRRTEVFFAGLQRFSEKLDNAIKNWFLGTFVAPVQRWVKRRVDFVKFKVENVRQNIMQIAIRWTGKIKNTVLHPLQSVKRGWRSIIRTAEKAGKGIEKAVQHFVQKFNAVKIELYRVFIAPVLAIHYKIQKFILMMPKRLGSFRKWVVYARSNPGEIFIMPKLGFPKFEMIKRAAANGKMIFKNRVDLLKVVSQNCAELLKKFAVPAFRIAFIMKSRISAGWNWAAGKVHGTANRLAEKITVPMRRVAARFSKKMSRASDRMRVLIAWITVLTKYGLKLVQDVANNKFIRSLNNITGIRG